MIAADDGAGDGGEDCVGARLQVQATQEAQWEGSA